MILRPPRVRTPSSGGANRPDRPSVRYDGEHQGGGSISSKEIGRTRLPGSRKGREGLAGRGVKLESDSPLSRTPARFRRWSVRSRQKKDAGSESGIVLVYPSPRS